MNPSGAALTSLPSLKCNFLLLLFGLVRLGKVFEGGGVGGEEDAGGESKSDVEM